MNFESFVLAASTADLGEAAAARDLADAIEFRMDLAADPLDSLADYEGELPILATNRASWEGGEAGDDRTRLDALEAALDHEAVAAVDVELASVTDGNGDRILEAAKDRNVATVVSAHEFEATPTREEMTATLRRACAYGDAGKLAVTAESVDDVLDLLVVTRSETAAGRTVATMAMGEAGRHSRAVAPLYGSRIGYAPVDPAKATAPGQYDLAALADLVGRLQPDTA